MGTVDLDKLMEFVHKFAGDLGATGTAGQAQRRAAAAAARLGEKAEARELLHAAHDTADRLGVRHLRDRCAVALAELGDKPGRRHGGAPKTAGLSSREMDVMRLVAKGNQQGGRHCLVHQLAHSRDARAEQPDQTALPHPG